MCVRSWHIQKSSNGTNRFKHLGQGPRERLNVLQLGLPLRLLSDQFIIIWYVFRAWRPTGQDAIVQTFTDGLEGTGGGRLVHIHTGII